MNCRRKIKHIHNAKINGEELCFRSKNLAANKQNKDEVKSKKNSILKQVKDMSDPKVKKNVLKIIKILDTV